MLSKKTSTALIATLFMGVSFYQINQISNVLATSASPITYPITYTNSTSTPTPTVAPTPATTSNPNSNGNNNSGSNNSGSNNNPSCNDQKPSSAPILTSAIVSGKNQITLKWAKAADPVSYYLVTYGLTANANQYGNPYIGDKNTTSYIVKGLSGGTAYFFKVRAGNGCTPGELSNVLKGGTVIGTRVNTPAQGFKPEVLGAKKTTVKNPTVQSNIVNFPIPTAGPARMIESSTGLLSFLSNTIAGFFK